MSDSVEANKCYNRYVYQGVGHDKEIQVQLKKLIAGKKAREEKNRFLLNQKPELFVI
ncbi:hypothetical protein [Nostoc sp.]|uniref:hypothetical protein n=1 Tax=Nostoc sp. TaxID=1180 RepID=UPI002FF90211